MMYAFLSLQAYLAVRAHKLTLAQAIKAGYIYNVLRTEVHCRKVDGLNICFWGIPF